MPLLECFPQGRTTDDDAFLAVDGIVEGVFDVVRGRDLGEELLGLLAVGLRSGDPQTNAGTLGPLDGIASGCPFEPGETRRRTTSLLVTT